MQIQPNLKFLQRDKLDGCVSARHKVDIDPKCTRPTGVFSKRTVANGIPVWNSPS